MKLSLIVISAAAMILSACTGGTNGYGTGGINKITRVDHTSYYSPEEVRAISQPRIPTVIYGPDNVRAQAERYARNVRVPGWISGNGLELINPDKDGTPEQRLVLVFYAGSAAQGYKACKSASEFGSQDQTSGLTVLAVLCSGDLTFARATLVNSSISGPDDPGYSAALNQLLVQLMPSRSPNRGDGEIRIRG